MSMSTLFAPTLMSNVQRCVVGPSELEQLQVPIGSWCIIQRDGYKSICSLWLRSDLQDGLIEVQDSVIIPESETQRACGKSFTSVESIHPVSKPHPCKEVRVTVVADLKNLRDLQCVSKEALTRQLQHQLIGCSIVEGCQVSLKSESQFAGPKISYVMVEECIPKEVSTSEATKAKEVDDGKFSKTSSPTDKVSSNSQVDLMSTNRTEDNTAPAESIAIPEVELFKIDTSVPGSVTTTQNQNGTQQEVDSTLSLPSTSDATSLEPNAALTSQPRTSSDRPSGIKLMLITQQTRIEIVNIMSSESLQRSRGKVRVGGLNEAASLLKKLVEYPAKYPETLKGLGLMQSHGILLRGPPGCGKTSLLQAVTSECKVGLLQINGAEIFGSSPGESESNLRRVFDEAKAISETHRCILFIDELDALCPKRDGGEAATHEGRVVAELLMLMDEIRGQSKLLVVGATSRPNALDPALRRPGRFDQEVLIGMPSVSQRAAILETHCKGIHLANDVDLMELAKRCNGYNGADLASLCQQAVFHVLERIATEKEKSPGTRFMKAPTVLMDDFIGSLSHVTPSLHRAAGSVVKELQPVPWNAIGGLEKVKAQLKQAVEWPMIHWQSFARLGLRGPSGVLLYGPPGCCKTTLAQAAATASKASFLSVSCAELYSPLVGDSEKIITEVFSKARLTTPSIVFLDELDSLIGGRGTDKGRGLSERLLSCLLIEMDGVGIPTDEVISNIDDKNMQSEFNRPRVLVVAASNRIDLIDPALLRPGRFDCLIYVPPPDKKERDEILAVYTKRMPLDEDVDIEKLAQATDMYTGADLEGLCREAGLLALQDYGLENSASCVVHQKHFLSALEFCSPSLNDKILANYQNVWS